MNRAVINLAGATLIPLPSGGLYWPDRGMLVVSDLHLGKSERMARRGGSLLPPYESDVTLDRLAVDISATDPETVLCLGDSFDDLEAARTLEDTHCDTLSQLQDGRRWLWIEGNHDSGATRFGGQHLKEHREGPLTFRHIAKKAAKSGEISGHYHPKARIRGGSRPCFLVDETRMICPAYGAYTGGLDWTTPVLRQLFSEHAFAFLTGHKVLQVPVPRRALCN